MPEDTAYIREMNDTIEKAIYAHRQLFEMGTNASSGMSMAEIANASQSFLKLAHEARISKFKHKLDLHKAMMEERKLKLAELKAFKEAGTVPLEDITTEETVQGIKMTPSAREQLLKENRDSDDSENKS